MAAKKATQQIFSGTPAVSGIVVGKCFVLEEASSHIPQYTLPPEETLKELARFQSAVKAVEVQLKTFKEQTVKLPEQQKNEAALLLDAHSAILTDKQLLHGVETEITNHHVNAEHAIEKTVQALTKKFKKIQDPYIAGRIDDIRDIAQRIQHVLLGRTQKSIDQIPKNTILIAHDFPPSLVVMLTSEQALGLVSISGGLYGHAAVIARARQIPLLTNTDPKLLDNIRENSSIALDCFQGDVILNPSRTTVAQFKERKENIQTQIYELEAISESPASTRDDQETKIYMNIDYQSDDLKKYAKASSGIGLLRTELLCLPSTKLPTTDEQFDMYKNIVLPAFKNKTVIIRTFDVGGDKHTPAFEHLFDNVANPALSMRGLRICLQYPDILYDQFRALLLLHELTDIHIMLPMVNHVDEVITARDIMYKAAYALQTEKKLTKPNLPLLGVMIETPGSAMIADAFAEAVDFISIGSNDLVQYTLAADRVDPRVSAYYDPYHPAVIRLLYQVIQAANNHNIPVSVCGELAGNTDFTGLLIGMGLRRFSMSPHRIPYVKKMIRQIDSRIASRAVDMIIRQNNIYRITSMIKELNASIRG